MPRLLRRRRPPAASAREAFRPGRHYDVSGVSLSIRNHRDEYGNTIIECTGDGRNWQIVETMEPDGGVTSYPFDPSPANMEAFNESIRRSLAERAARRGVIGSPVRIEGPARVTALDSLREENERLRQQLEEQRRALQPFTRSVSGDFLLSVGPMTGDIVFPRARDLDLPASVMFTEGEPRVYATAMFIPRGSAMMPWDAPRARVQDEQLRPPEPTPPPVVPDLDNPDPNPLPKGVNPRAWGVVEALGKQLKEKKDEQGSS